MKRNVVVTFADQRYAIQAKQLFAGVYFNASWSGDLLLFSHQISEGQLDWFRGKGILVKECQPFFRNRIGRWPALTASKLYLFAEEMKKWDKVIYLDLDIIVRASLDQLTKIKGYAAAPELDQQPLFTQFNLQNKHDWLALEVIKKRLNQNFKLTDSSFNAGVIVLSTDIIQKETLKELIEILRACRNISANGEQTAQNLFFYRRWIKLPRVYNLHPLLYTNLYHVDPSQLRGICLHFSGENKPWLPRNPFYKEWKKNLEKAEQIGMENQLESVKVWSKNEIWSYEKYLTLRRLIYAPLRTRLYKIDIWLRILKFSLQERNPRLHIFLKKIFGKLTKNRKEKR